MQLKAVSAIFTFNFPYPSSVIVPGLLRVEVMAVFPPTIPLSFVSLPLSWSTHHLPADTSHGRRALAIM